MTTTQETNVNTHEPMTITAQPISLADLTRKVESGELKEHHTALCRGYVSRKSEGLVHPYKGRFGTGYKLLTPNWDSTQYCHVTYYVYPSLRLAH